MENKKIVKIKDDISSHDCSVFPDTNNLIFIRNQIENGDIEILDDDNMRTEKCKERIDKLKIRERVHAKR